MNEIKKRLKGKLIPKLILYICYKLYIFDLKRDN